MKSAIVAICLLTPLVIIFVMIDRKDFYSGDDVAVQQETVTGRNPTTVTKLKPVEKPAETKLATETKPVETKPLAESNPVESKPAAEPKPAEVKPTETKPTEMKPVAETKPVAEEKLVPAAIPVVTAEEAEKLNAEALVEVERLLKIMEKERERLERGYSLAFSEYFKDYKKVSLSKTNEEQLSRKSYDLEEFKKREIPSVWNLDYTTVPSEASFKNTDDGYSIVSEHGVIRFMGQRMDSMRSSFIFELTVKNNSDKDTEIVLGVHDSGILKNGYKTLVSETIHGKEEKTINAELSVFEQLANIAPTISVKGAITLKDLIIYKKTHADISIVEGEITERSLLPAPEDTDYPDCRFTVHFIGNAILSGMPCNKELALSLDGFLKKKVLPTNQLKVGDKIRCAIISINSLPEELAGIQEADDLSLFTLDSYFVSTYSKITEYMDFTRDLNALIPFKSDSFEFKSVFDCGFNPPIPDDIKEAQKERIKKDLDNANLMLSYLKENSKKIEQDFQAAWTKEKERYPDDFNTIKNERGDISLYWRNIDNSFWCLPPRHTLIPQPQEMPKNNLDAIVAFKDFLESNGIQLIVSLVPYHYSISSRIINPDFRGVPEIQCALYTKQLSEAGVECPYEPDRIIDNYNKFQFAFMYSDYHPGATTQYSIAEVIADRLSNFNFPKKYDKSMFSYIQKRFHLDLFFPPNCDIGINTANERLIADMICYNGKELETKDVSSEILLLANSFGYTPGNRNGQHSLPAFLAERMLYPVDDYYVTSQGPMTVIVQRMFQQPESFLRDKKVVILQMGVSHCMTSLPWNNISDMNQKKLMLNGKKLVDTLYITGNGDFADDFVQEFAKRKWKSFEEKKDVKCFDDEKFVIFDQTLHKTDPSKPFVCVVQTVRSSFFQAPPTLITNGIKELIPATYDPAVLFWQDIYFGLPAGTTQLTIELQGKRDTLVGFNKILIYQ